MKVQFDVLRKDTKEVVESYVATLPNDSDKILDKAVVKVVVEFSAENGIPVEDFFDTYDIGVCKPEEEEKESDEALAKQAHSLARITVAMMQNDVTAFAHGLCDVKNAFPDPSVLHEVLKRSGFGPALEAFSAKCEKELKLIIESMNTTKH